MPLASSSLLLAALSVPVPAQVTESAQQLEVRDCLRSIRGGFRGRGEAPVRILTRRLLGQSEKVAFVSALTGRLLSHFAPVNGSLGGSAGAGLVSGVRPPAARLGFNIGEKSL